MMITLLEFREQLKNFYAKFEVYITPLYKFLVSLTAFLLINQNMGYLRPVSYTHLRLEKINEKRE